MDGWIIMVMMMKIMTKMYIASIGNITLRVTSYAMCYAMLVKQTIPLHKKTIKKNNSTFEKMAAGCLSKNEHT